MLYKLGLLISLLLPVSAVAQKPVSVRITTTDMVDSVRFTVSWPKLVTVTTTYNTYDVLTFSNPRLIETEQLRVVTGTSWSLTVPKNKLSAGLKFYASVRVSSTPTYGAITYTTPAAEARPALVVERRP